VPTSARPASRTAGRGAERVRYAELHCHSNFSFLDGASHPEELAEEAARLGLDALAITDHDGFYGVVRFAEAARAVGLPTVFGAELTLADGLGSKQTTIRPGPPDPAGEHLLVLARDPTGYARLATAISAAQMAGSKGEPRIGLDSLADLLGQGHHRILTGCRKGTVPAALTRDGPAAAGRALDQLIELFGRDAVAVELWNHHDPLDDARNDALATLAVRAGTEVLATNNVHYATTSQRPLATALAAVRARRSLDELDGWLPGGGTAHLRSGEEQARRFARYPGVVETAARIGAECAFDLRLVAPALPPYPCPPEADGTPRDEITFLRHLTRVGAAERYGAPGSSQLASYVARVGQDPYVTLAHELDLIASLGFPGYFLIVWDIVDFCRKERIFCQGRGSAANSAVCYALGITNADAVGLKLLFERFLSPERDGPPDIDIDIESDRREEVIQYVYRRYGRTHAAQVANVITYRAKSSVRDMARALGYAPGQQDAWSKEIDRWGGVPRPGEGSVQQVSAPDVVLDLASQVEHFPRHLGIHSGGMVICDRPVIEVCPTEWGAMENRSVLQWDKDDCAAAGLVKFDLLGLGMLSALHGAVDLIEQHTGEVVDIALVPQEDCVYDMICAADTIGVFQIESRAQMATLPRLRPRTFYDLVVEVALIRPGPIQGGSVHPYIRRRNGQEAVTYLHPLLEPALGKTLGIPLFQEQLMQMSIDVAGFTPAEADQLRQAMGSKRSREKMERLKVRLFEGMAARGIIGDVADQIFHKLAAFANYGFPESHSVSFAYLVYASSWIKYHHPAAFCAALLNAQPMGFYSPHTLVQDARRHGVVVRTPDVNASDWCASLEPDDASTGERSVRLGIGSVRSIGEDLARAIATGRPYIDVEDVARRGGGGRVGVPRPALEAMATAGAFGCFDLDRRQGLWTAGAAARSPPDRLPGTITGLNAPTLPGMSDQELAMADLWATGVSPDGHPTRFLRSRLTGLGVVTSAGLVDVEPGSKVRVAGVVTHRQRPATAGGTMFINLEDETGLINVICSLGCWTHHRSVVRGAPALMIRGRLERSEGVVNVIAERIEPLPVAASVPSRDFR